MWSSYECYGINQANAQEMFRNAWQILSKMLLVAFLLKLMDLALENTGPILLASFQFCDIEYTCILYIVEFLLYYSVIMDY